jgi:transposase
MLKTTPSQQIFLALMPVDMRGGFDRLAAHVLQAGLELYSGHLFVFVSRRRTHLKVLTWDGTGMIVLYKRLSRGCFTLPTVTGDGRTANLDAEAFATLLRGIRLAGVERSPSARAPTPAMDGRDAT